MSKSLFRFIRILLLSVSLFALTACFQVETVVRVNPDGSGLIEETFLMKKEFLDQIRMMAEGMAKEIDQAMSGSENQGENPRSKAKEFDIFDEPKLRERAKDMGDGVTYVKGAKMAAGGYEGYKATYSFTDISKVRINQNPGEKVPGEAEQGGPASTAKKEYLTFKFTKGNPAELIVISPASAFEKKPESSEELKQPQSDVTPTDAMLSQMAGFFRGMKFGMSVVVDGDIIETNATHRDGSRIDLLELDFGKLLESPEKFRKFSESKPKTVEEAKLLMQDLPGIKVDLNRETRIKFVESKTRGSSQKK